MATDKVLAGLRRGVEFLETEGELKAKLDSSQKTGKPLRVKLGIDPTGPEIHLGFAVVLRKLRQFQDAGHLAVLIVGDFTARIGDPSGQSRTRPQLTYQEVRENMKRYKELVFEILDPDRCEFRYNAEWSDRLTGLDIIDIASKYTVARIIEREDFRARLDNRQPLYIHELLYPLFQGYDSVAVEADVEVGGTDQYLNLLVGRVLQREFGQEPQVVLTMPLLVGLDGKLKMSKSYGNYVSIKDPAAEMFGKLMSIPDELIMDYFLLCTNRAEAELEAVEKRLKTGANPRDIKAELAGEVTATYHSAKAAEEAADEFDRVFRQKELPGEMPEYGVGADGVNIVDLVAGAGLLPSKSEARRKLSEGAVYLDGERIDDMRLLVRVEAEPRVLKVGRRRFLKLVRE
ncbi:MAG: tyrosine--tRNA ligase [candidate division WOR-3 bacterium]|nr:MAG: tyrosine--tRNA ligase [candidate division WOR-3 bacterium]